MKHVKLAAVAALLLAPTAGAFAATGGLGAISINNDIPALYTFKFPILGGFALQDIPVLGAYPANVTVSELISTGETLPQLLPVALMNFSGLTNLKSLAAIGFALPGVLLDDPKIVSFGPSTLNPAALTAIVTGLSSFGKNGFTSVLPGLGLLQAVATP